MKTEIKNKKGEVIFTHDSADLRGVDLRSVDLRGADLRYVDLRDANLRGVDLRGADLRYADLRGANLSGANLRCADLSYVDLRCADLSGADLRYADLSDANLSGADLRGSALSGADLRGSIGIRYSQCSFDAHGECGRMLSAVVIKDDIVLFCGCLKGSEQELRDYIEKGEDKYKESRLYALEFVLGALKLNRG